MSRGANSKQLVINKIMEVYPDAFIYGKELRIPMEEDGERVEIKVALTCAKTNVGDAEVVTPTVTEAASNVSSAPTEQEIDNIKNLMDKLGI